MWLIGTTHVVTDDHSSAELLTLAWHVDGDIYTEDSEDARGFVHYRRYRGPAFVGLVCVPPIGSDPASPAQSFQTSCWLS